MPRACTVCIHPERAAIDAALVAGGSLRDIAGQFTLSKSSLERHKADHLPALLVKAAATSETERAGDLLAEARALKARTMKILDRAERVGDLRVALQAIREARGCIDLLKAIHETEELESRLTALEAQLTGIGGSRRWG